MQVAIWWVFRETPVAFCLVSYLVGLSKNPASRCHRIFILGVDHCFYDETPKTRLVQQT
jgi:hypothetical protein